jgi:tetratricopeptide (TPR) repeat protein
LLSAAEKRLLTAQELNPLNTDHTANLARLNTRWAAAGSDDGTLDLKMQLAEQYYQDALVLSPQNSIIRNEYARFAFELNRDCDQTIALYNESLAIDPFFAETILLLQMPWLPVQQHRSMSLPNGNYTNLRPAHLLKVSPANQGMSGLGCSRGRYCKG